MEFTCKFLGSSLGGDKNVWRIDIKDEIDIKRSIWRQSFWIGPDENQIDSKRFSRKTSAPKVNKQVELLKSKLSLTKQSMSQPLCGTKWIPSE